MPSYTGVGTSLELYARAAELIPGRTQLISRRASQFAYGVSPIYAERAKGSRFVDVDGNEFIDWVNAVTAVILGHADDVVDGAVKEQIDRGSIYTLNSALEVELAEILIDTIPSAEMVRYTKGGGEACAVAARIARGTTGREKILICGYHGWHDWYQAANFQADPETGDFPFAGIEPIGVPRGLEGSVIPFTYGKPEMVEALLQEHDGDVAAIMMEPARSQLPPAGYLERIQELARKHGAILIFDEVSCGWRFRIGGIQAEVGVTPDMTVVAKAISNGYAMGAVVGSRQVMEPAGRMFVSSSYWSDNVGLAASAATITELKRRDSERRFREIGAAVTTRLQRVLADVGIAGEVVGLETTPTLSIDSPDELTGKKISTLFCQEMARRGIYCKFGFISTLAHTQEDIDLTGEAATEVLGIIKSALDKGDLDNLIDCDMSAEPFRRLVS
jgi:glutamate-1-semialdehyde 2,1-aminomutase